MKRKPFNKTVAMLNAAFNADPNAIYTLICNRIPCNAAMANTPHVRTHRIRAKKNCNQIGALGLINGALSANGLPLVAASFEPVTGQFGEPRLIGFVEYIPLKPLKAKQKEKPRR
jgi:hypothetical protein